MSDFHQLFDWLSKYAGIATRKLEPDASGHIRLGMNLCGVEITVSHDPKQVKKEILLCIEFGSYHPGAALEACRALMDVNSLMLWNPSCSFGLDPATHRIKLQYTYPLEHATGRDLLSRLVEVVEVVHCWRNHHFLNEDGVSPLAC